MDMFWTLVVVVAFWGIVVIPWYHRKLHQGQTKPVVRVQRTTHKRPRKKVYAPIGTWWQRKIINWF